MKKLLLATTLLVPLSAQAADLQLKAIPFALPTVDLTNWTGFYGGVGLTGLNQGANVIGGGLASLNSSGTMPDLHFGAMTVNKTYLLGAEVGGGYLTNMGDVSVPTSRWQGYFDMRAGGSLAGLFGTPPPQAPTAGGPFNFANIQAMFASAMPYVHVGTTFDKRSLSGLGLYVPLNHNLFMNLQYDYYTPGNGVQQAQGARLGINWAF